MPNIDDAFGIHDQALVLRARRAELLAGNLANADTPGYKARDVDFKAALEKASAGPAASRLQTTNARHLTGNQTGIGGLNLLYRVPLQPSLDGNTVDTQAEQAAFMENAVRYQASLRFLNSRIQGLMRVLREE